MGRSLQVPRFAGVMGLGAFRYALSALSVGVMGSGASGGGGTTHGSFPTGAAFRWRYGFGRVPLRIARIVRRRYVSAASGSS